MPPLGTIARDDADPDVDFVRRHYLNSPSSDVRNLAACWLAGQSNMTVIDLIDSIGRAVPSEPTPSNVVDMVRRWWRSNSRDSSTENELTSLVSQATGRTFVSSNCTECTGTMYLHRTCAACTSQLASTVRSQRSTIDELTDARQEASLESRRLRSEVDSLREELARQQAAAAATAAATDPATDPDDPAAATATDPDDPDPLGLLLDPEPPCGCSICTFRSNSTGTDRTVH